MAFLPPTRTIRPATSSQPTFPLLDLPSELRLKVFDYYFQDRHVLVRCQHPGCHINHHTADDRDDAYGANDPNSRASLMSITRVSKLVRAESMSCLLQKATFDFQLLDYHLGWTPGRVLLSCIERMRNMYGPPRLLHFLGLTTLRWTKDDEQMPRWVKECTASNIICDMILDQYDLEDALSQNDSNEARYWEGVRGAINDPRGSRLTLRIMVEDGDLVWDGGGAPSSQSRIQVSKRKVSVCRKPSTEEGKIKLKGLLTLLGLELQDKDKKMIEPKKADSVPNVATTNPGTGPVPAAFTTAPGVANPAAVINTTGTATTVPLPALNVNNQGADTNASADNAFNSVFPALDELLTDAPNDIRTNSNSQDATHTTDSSVSTTVDPSNPDNVFPTQLFGLLDLNTSSSASLNNPDNAI